MRMMDFSDHDGVIWYDGEWVQWRDATTHVLTHSLHYGMGIYEGIRAYTTEEGPALFRLSEHVDRFMDSAKLIQMQMPYTYQEISDACVEAVERNELDSAYIRPMAFLGSEGMGLHAENLQTHMIIAAWSWGAYLGQDALKNGIRIKTSTFRRIHYNSLLTKAKVNGHYVNSMLALREATNSGYDEALLLDHLGFVAEGSGENFFMVKDGVVHTPASHSILLGITRQTVMDLCKKHGISVIERSIVRDEIYLADEAFFTGTAAEITPIVELDDRTIGDGAPGEITRMIQQLYFSIVHGREAEHQEWLTYCDE